MKAKDKKTIRETVDKDKLKGFVKEREQKGTMETLKSKAKEGLEKAGRMHTMGRSKLKELSEDYRKNEKSNAKKR